MINISRLSYILTSKERAELRSQANALDTTLMVGKGGITEPLVKTVSDALEAREIVKLSVLETAPLTPKECMQELVQLLSCEAVQVIGRKIVLYRESKENKRIFLPR